MGKKISGFDFVSITRTVMLLQLPQFIITIFWFAPNLIMGGSPMTILWSPPFSPPSITRVHPRKDETTGRRGFVGPSCRPLSNV